MGKVKYGWEIGALEGRFMVTLHVMNTKQDLSLSFYYCYDSIS